MKRVVDWLVYLVVRILICVVQAMRIEACATLARWLAALACDLLQVRRALVDENLRHAFPHLSSSERRDLSRRMWEHLFLMVCEVAHAPRKIHSTNWRQHVDVRGADQIVRYMLDPRPIIFVSGHFGNFEMAGFTAGLLGLPTYAIARPLDNPYLHRYLTKFRESTGQYIFPKEGSAPLVQAALESGGALALLADQHAGDKGVWVDFFGRPASCHKALALFTLVNGAPLLVCYAKRAGGPLRFELGVAGVADPAQSDERTASVTALTAWYSHVLEDAVRESPEQYWWLHRRWRTPPQRMSRKAA